MKTLFFVLCWTVCLASCNAQEKNLSKVDLMSKEDLNDVEFVVENLGDFKGSITLVLTESGVDAISINDDIPPTRSEIVCDQSGNVKFAKCVGKWLANNPGKCLKVWHDDDGNHADDDCTRGAN